MALAKKSATVIIFALLGVLYVVFITPKIFKISELQSRSNLLEKELGKLKSQNASLERELRLLRDDPVYIEKIAREKFNKAKEGEIVYKVLRQDEAPAGNRPS